MDKELMRRAVSLAKRGYGFVNPNPMVGAVIEKNGRIIGEGYHQRYGELHAERNALAALTESPEGATMYVTLEPCCHYGKTPPCTEAIIQAHIAKVVIGSRDPNPKVCGKGAKALREAGVDVTEGFLREECDAVNKVFFHYITTGLPYVALKYAMTADGKTATAAGASKWITGEQAREHVHTLRHCYSAIMVGVGTVLHDDPLLTCRMEGGKNPRRIICDSNLKIPVDSNIAKTSASVHTLVAAAYPSKEKIKLLEECGIEVIEVPNGQGQVDLPMLMRKVSSMGIDSILLEGGGTLAYSAVQEGIVNKVFAYVAPKLFGGISSKTPLGGIGVSEPEDCYTLESPIVTALGSDVLLEYDVKKGGSCVYRDH